MPSVSNIVQKLTLTIAGKIGKTDTGRSVRQTKHFQLFLAQKALLRNTASVKADTYAIRQRGSATFPNCGRRHERFWISIQRKTADPGPCGPIPANR